MKTITICSSADFYKKVVEVQTVLEAMGFAVLIPETAEKMKLSGDFDASHHRTWFNNPEDYKIKTGLMMRHFDKVAKADAVLVVNEEKHDIKNYIGGNVLMEMAVAFHKNIPIYIFNEIPEESKFLEEIIAMFPAELHGDVSGLQLS